MYNEYNFGEFSIFSSLGSNKAISVGFTVGRTKRKRKEMCRGEARMGYCPFPVSGRDTALVLRQARCRRAPGCTQPGSTQPGLRTGASGSSRNLFSWTPCRDINSCVATWLWVIGIVVHHDTSLVLRQGSDAMDQF